MNKAKKIIPVIAAALLLSAGQCEKSKDKKKLTTKESKQKKDSATSAATRHLFEEDFFDVEQIENKIDTKALEQKAAAAEDEINNLIAMLEQQQKINQSYNDFNQSFKTVFFENNSTNLEAGQDLIMEDNFNKAKKAAESGKKLVVRAHCDLNENHKNEPANIMLAKNRAQAMKNELINHGISPESIEIAAIGSAEPLVYSNNASQKNSDKLVYNRRIELITI